VDAETGYHAWSRSFDRKFEHLFELQDELAREVARNMRVGAAPDPQPPSNDLEAYVLLLRAASLGQRIGDETSVRAAIDLLNSAIQRDRGFARAFAWLAMCYMSCVEMGYPVPDALAHAERAAEEALNLDPGIADVHAMLGALCTLRGRWVECAARYETAVALSSDPIWRRWRALFLLQSAGQIREAVRQLDVELHDPELGMWTAIGLAIAHVLLGNDVEARGFVDLALPKGHPHGTTPLNDLYAQLAIRSKHYDEAAEELAADVSRPMQLPGAKEAVRLMCAALAGSVDKRIAVTAMRDFEDRLGPDGPDHATCKRLILWYTMLGAPDVAHDCATRCLDVFMRSGTVGSTWAVVWMPEMRPFRNDPRFENFVARLGLVPYWEQYGPPDGYDLVRGKLVARE
jgi:Tfp pilus assembly protein PilF